MVGVGIEAIIGEPEEEVPEDVEAAAVVVTIMIKYRKGVIQTEIR